MFSSGSLLADWSILNVESTSYAVQGESLHVDVAWQIVTLGPVFISAQPHTAFAAMLKRDESASLGERVDCRIPDSARQIFAF